jgi:hypothetical protein
MLHYAADDAPPLLDPATFAWDLCVSSLMNISCTNVLPGDYLYRSFVLAGLGAFPSFSSWSSFSHAWLVAVLLIYDHTLTLATEVKFIWAAKFRPSIYWFLAVRYIGLAANIANCVLYFAELSREVRVPLFALVQALNDLSSEVWI